jgi:hypothetical protein
MRRKRGREGNVAGKVTMKKRKETMKLNRERRKETEKGKRGEGKRPGIERERYMYK